MIPKTQMLIFLSYIILFFKNKLDSSQAAIHSTNDCYVNDIGSRPRPTYNYFFMCYLAQLSQILSQ